MSDGGLPSIGDEAAAPFATSGRGTAASRPIVYGIVGL